MKSSQVSFAQLQNFQEQLGFSQERDQKGWRFEHAASNTVFLLREYRPTDRVYEHDLFLIRSQLNGRGLMTEQRIDESLVKAPA